jgi:hypothetical protein
MLDVRRAVVFEQNFFSRNFFFKFRQHRNFHRPHIHTKIRRTMLTARSLLKIFAPQCRFIPHSSSCIVSFPTSALLLPARRWCCHGSGAVADADAVADAASSHAIAAAKVAQAAALVADARAAVNELQECMAYSNSRVKNAAAKLDPVRAAAALKLEDLNIGVAIDMYEESLEERKRCEAELTEYEDTLLFCDALLKDREAELAHRENTLNFCDGALKHREAELAKARAAQAVRFRRVAPDVALKELGELAVSKRFEVPTQALEEIGRHVRTLRDLTGTRLVHKDAIPSIVVAAAAGAGQTTLLRYLQQTADTVRYGAELQADTNWLVKGWAGTARCEVKAVVQSTSPLRHVFVGVATFSGTFVNFEADIDTESAIERRCAWRILHDAGLVPDWIPSFGLDFTQAAKMLRATISAAKGCTPDEVAIVFLIDGTRAIFPEGPRRVLLDALAAWQQQDLSASRCSVSAVGGPPLFDVVCEHSRPTVALQLLPLVEIPRQLAAEVTSDARFDRSRQLQLQGYIKAAGGHPRTLERIADALKYPRDKKKVTLPAPNSARGLSCVWDVFAAGALAGRGGYSVDPRDLASAPQYEFHRWMLLLNCLRRHTVETSDAAQHDAPQRITLTAAPSALFLAQDSAWTWIQQISGGFPSYGAVVAVQALMQVPVDVAGNWAFAFAGALHLAAQCVLRARLNEVATPRQELRLRGSVPFKDLVPNATIGCQCADLQYVVRDEFVQTVDRALTRDDFQKLRDASCVHTEAPFQEAAEYAIAAEFGGEDAVLVGARRTFLDVCRHGQVDEWIEQAERRTRGLHQKGDKKFRVLLCVTDLPQAALETIKARAANKDDRLSRAIIIDATSASQLFEWFGLSLAVEASLKSS